MSRPGAFGCGPAPALQSRHEPLYRFFAAAVLLPGPALAAGAVEAAGVTQITGLENTYPAWSPDGTRLVFESTRDGPDADIFVMNADGTAVVQLTDNDAGESTPSFTPDGRFVIYTSEQDGNPDIFRMRADGSEKVTSRNTRARTAIPASRPTAGGSSSTATEPATRRASRAAPWSATRITRSSR